MNSSMPLITIAIPTFNRLETLRDTLEILSTQDGFFDSEVEIVISDNASPVDPTSMLLAFQEKHGRPLILHRNLSNGGIDGNIHRVAEMATGRYVLFMSDDDILLPGTLRKLQQMVQNESGLLFCFVNAFPFSGSYVAGMDAPAIIKIDDQISTTSNDEFIEAIWIWATFLSSFFVERTAWISVKNREQYIGTDIYLTHVLYRLLSDGRDRLKVVTAERLVAARMEYTGSFRIFHAFGLHFMKLLCEDAPRLGFSKKALRAVKLRTIKEGLPPMIMMVRCGLKPRRLSLGELGILFKYTWMEPLTFIYLLPLVVLPARFLLWLRAIKHEAKRRPAESTV
jgi:abequosyltransferase